jgi:integrase
MPSTYQRGNAWYVDLRDVGGGRVSLRTTDEAVARLKAAELERAAYLGVTSVLGKAASGPTLGAAFDKALRLHWRGHKSVETVLMRRKAIYETIPPGTPLSAIDNTRVENLVSALQAKGNSLTTVNRNLQALRTVLKLAQGWGMMVSVPRLPNFKEPEGRTRTYTAVEEGTIVGAFREAGKEWMADLTVVLIDSGLRLGELLACEKLLHEGHQVRVWGTKNGKERVVPLTTRAGAALTRFLALPSSPSKHIVEWNWQQMRRNIRMDGDKGFVIHALRHTCCTRLLQSGLDVSKVQKWMGHLDIETTLRYTHLEDADLAQGAAALEAYGEVCQ